MSPTAKIRSRFSLLLAGLAVVLGLYHASNWPIRGKVRRPWLTWVQFSLGTSKKGLHLALPSFAYHPTPDEASDLLGKVGSIFRYELGEYPFEMVGDVRDGMLRLFVRNEIKFQYPEVVEPLFKGPFLAEGSKFFERLKKGGVTPLMLAIPTKVSIDRKHLPASLPTWDEWTVQGNPGAEDPNVIYQRLLSMDPGHAVDLYQAFSKASASGEVYLPSDYHWSSLGIAAAAKTTVEKLNSLGFGLPVPQLKVVTVQSAYNQWLLKTLNLPSAFLRSRPEFQWKQPIYDLEATTDRQIASTPSGRLVVAGTSFMELPWESEAHRFAQLLARYLRRELVIAYLPGGNAGGALQMLARDGFEFRPGDVFVWEYPVAGLPSDSSFKIPVLGWAK